MSDDAAQNVYSLDLNVPADEYDRFVTVQRTCNLLQSSGWARVKNNWSHRLTALRDTNGNIRVAALVLIRPLKLGYTMWYLPHGPITDFSPGKAEAIGRYESHILSSYLNQLAHAAKTDLENGKCAFIKVDPPIAVQAAPQPDLTGEYSPEALVIADIFEKNGYRHQGFPKAMHATLQPRFDSITLNPGKDVDYEASLPKRTRTFARNARNRYVRTKSGGVDNLSEFLKVIKATEDTKRIHLRDGEYYQRILKTYGQDAQIWLAYLRLDEAIDGYQKDLEKVEHKIGELGERSPKKVNQLQEEALRLQKRRDELRERRTLDGSEVTLAGVLMVRYGSGAEMLYAGTNRNYGNITAQELLWVDAISAGFSGNNQLRYVNMGGISGTLDDSLTAFKSRFNAVIVEKLGEFDRPIHPLIYRVVRWYLNRT